MERVSQEYPRFVHGTCTRWMLDRRAHAVPFWLKPWPPPVFSSPTIQWEMREMTGRGAGAGEDDDEKGLERLKPLRDLTGGGGDGDKKPGMNPERQPRWM